MVEAHPNSCQELISSGICAVATFSVDDLGVACGRGSEGLEVGKAVLTAGRGEELELTGLASDDDAAKRVGDKTFDKVSERREPVHPRSPEVRQLRDGLHNSVELR